MNEVSLPDGVSAARRLSLGPNSVIYYASFNRALTDQELKSLSEDAWRVFTQGKPGLRQRLRQKWRAFMSRLFGDE